jgi:hypothetical protein
MAFFPWTDFPLFDLARWQRTEFASSQLIEHREIASAARPHVFLSGLYQTINHSFLCRDTDMQHPSNPSIFLPSISSTLDDLIDSMQ